MFAKKSLGQNFLKSESALNKIIEAGKISVSDFVLEIGPGRGALTEKILATGTRVLAIEKDSELIEFLSEKFRENIASDQLTILNKDILEFDETTIDQPYKLIANIPYYITGAIIRKFLSSANQPSHAVLLVQKEVANRIVARPEKNEDLQGKESLLSMSVKAYAEPKYIKTVPAGSFAPAPNVDSAIIALENISKNNFTAVLPDSKYSVAEKENIFFDLIHAGFAHKRKVLRKNLESLKNSEFFAGMFTKKNTASEKNILPAEKIRAGFQQIERPETVRAEDLSLDNWFDLIKIFLN
jgi:16S rRNA (adenine1518-N6/adenine1519-N6)-dimethyltransferase